MQLPIASHELSADEIRHHYGPLLRAGVEAFRRDPEYLVAVAEDWARVHRPPMKKTQGTAERYQRAALTREKRDEHEMVLRQAFADDLTAAEIAVELGISTDTVLYRWHRMGLVPASRNRARVRAAGKSGRPPKAVTAERERVVRIHATQGLTQEQTAEFLGISQAGVSLIRMRLGITRGTPPSIT